MALQRGRPIRVAVICTGRMGTALALELTAAGHEVRIGSRDRERGRRKAAEVGAAFGGTYRTAAANAEAVILAVPWTGVVDALTQIGDVDLTHKAYTKVQCTLKAYPDANKNHGYLYVNQGLAGGS